MSTEDDHHEETVMTTRYSNPGLDAELAYRREVLECAGRRFRTGRSRRFPIRRRNEF